MFTPRTKSAASKPSSTQATSSAARAPTAATVSYVEGWYVIAKANRIFGFGNWDAETVEMKREHDPCRSRRPRRTPSQAASSSPLRGQGARHGVEQDAPARSCASARAPPGLRPDRRAGRRERIKAAETDATKRAFVIRQRRSGWRCTTRTRRNVGRRGGSGARSSRATTGPWRRSTRASTSRSPSDRRPASAPWRCRHGRRPPKPTGEDHSVLPY